MTEWKLTEPVRGMNGGGASDQCDLAGADLQRMPGERLDHWEWRIANDRRWRRPALQEVLHAAARVTPVNNVDGDDAIAGGLGSVGDSSGPTARIEQRCGAIKLLDIEQADA